MPVVIHEFEAVSESQDAARGERGAVAEDTPGRPDAGPGEPRPEDLQPVLRALQARALRAWAH